MTEAEWLAGTDPIEMLAFLETSGQVSDRKLRLFAVACSHRIWGFLDDLGRGAVAMAELFADGLTGTEELRAARLACKSVSGRAVWYAAASDPRIAARNTALSIQSGVDAEGIAQAKLLHDLVGNPFRAVSFDATWRTPAVVSLAQTMYAMRNFDRMPLLGDALETAGCTQPDILDHCRSPGEHVRGCWVIDLLLGKPG